MNIRKIIYLLSFFIVLSEAASVFAGEITVYSARKEHLVKPLFDAYSEKTGIKIKYLTGEEATLLHRLKAEGVNTPADMLITVDAGNLWHAAREGVLQAVNSPELNKNIPEHLRDPEGNWFGLSIRARTIVYNIDKVQPEQLDSYEVGLDHTQASLDWIGKEVKPRFLRNSKLKPTDVYFVPA